MKMKELQNMSATELQRQLSALREQFRDLRFRIKSKEVKNNHQLKVVRSDIARILTILNQEK